MGLRFNLARAVAATSTVGLKYVFRRPAANFPGKVALYVDPQLLAHLRSRVDASLCVVGTNGKTTVTNLLADAFEAAGRSVVCNRTGANLDSGVSTALLHAQHADWGIFECDELWLAKILPFLQSDYVLLLNLFRDQLDRVGEIDHIQQSIAGALERSPRTTLVYNADDPLCQAIADAVPNASVPFGLAQDMGLAQNTVADARMCQHCSTMLEYSWRQYGQLGDYKCPNCGFARSTPEYAAHGIGWKHGLGSFTVSSPAGDFSIATSLPGAYMVYNLLAAATAASLAGIPVSDVQRAIDAFNPENGRLQRYSIGGRDVLLNLAKNPTGFNQNLKIVMQDEGPKAVAFFINDKEADGRDVSWLWDIDFQELAADPDLRAFAGGLRKHDMQVRLKYAGLEAELVDDAQDFVARALALGNDAKLYAIANYTALPAVKAQLDALAVQSEASDAAAPLAVGGNMAGKVASTTTSADSEETAAGAHAASNAPAPDSAPNPAPNPAPAPASVSKLVIAHLFPMLLNLYGDGGNLTVLVQRARAHGLDVEVRAVNEADELDFSEVDIMFLGGGPDREQHLASQRLLAVAPELRAYVEDDGVLLAICGGFQIIGREWLMGDETVQGLGLAGLTTKRVEGGSHNRLVGNIVLESPLATHPVVGYENHAGRTYLDEGVQPFGRVMDAHGKGNNGADKGDGVLYRNVVGTYLHGPLLAKNPEVADWLIGQALDRRAAKGGKGALGLASLDDSVELAANAALCERLGVR